MKVAIFDAVTGEARQLFETDGTNSLVQATLCAPFGGVSRVLDWTPYVVCNDPKFLPTLEEFDALWPPSPE